MARRSRLALVAIVVLLEIAVVFVTGMPVRWTRGVVLPDGCEHDADAYACRIVLVSDGTRLTARSGRAIAPGTGVALLAWRDLASGDVSYTVVR